MGFANQCLFCFRVGFYSVFRVTPDARATRSDSPAKFLEFPTILFCTSAASSWLSNCFSESFHIPSAFEARLQPRLWRAAYAGNHELIRQLLRSGGDPRECDEQGARPIDVASNAQSREYLVCWDPASTDRIKDDKRKAAKNAEKEEKAKFKRQQQELVDSLEESERRMQVSKSELARARKLLVDYRQQKVSFVEQGASEKLAELEPLIESAEAQVKLFEGSAQEWEWKASRARLKMNDLEQAKKEKEAKAAGKLRGFKVQVNCASLEELESVLPKLSNTLEAALLSTFPNNSFQLKEGCGSRFVLCEGRHFGVRRYRAEWCVIRRGSGRDSSRSRQFKFQERKRLWPRGADGVRHRRASGACADVCCMGGASTRSA